MALLFLEEDPWLLEHDSCEKLYRDIMEQLTIRQKHSRSSDKYSQLSATIRLRLKQFNNEVGQLQQKLNATAKLENITPAESERRTRQIEILHSKATQIQKIFNEQIVSKVEEDRKRLIDMAGPSEWSHDHEPTDRNASLSVGDLRAGQKKLLGEQERGLENLSNIISRQKDIAHTISNEVDYHNEILDGIGNEIDQTDVRVRTETRHIDTVSNKDKTCIYWVVIVLLLISIIVVAAL